MTLIVLVKGGLGNQLFCYAAARRLALVNDVELAIDDVSGFVRDHRYRRQYALDHFAIPVRKATPRERMTPFEGYRRALAKRIARRQVFEHRSYIEQEGDDFDDRLLHLRLRRGVTHLDGHWQSERYFMDVEGVIRDDLRFTPPPDEVNRAMAEKIASCCSVALHVRWFDGLNVESQGHNVTGEYYWRAIELMRKEVPGAHFFLFSDNPGAATAMLGLQENMMTMVDHNRGNAAAPTDLWLMSRCKHFIIANSTFSWWGAWLSGYKEKVVISPGRRSSGVGAWGFAGQIPEGWIVLSPASTQPIANGR